jgi:hypothetical protein
MSETEVANQFASIFERSFDRVTNGLTATTPEVRVTHLTRLICLQ